jgi:hypothetical protein
MSSAGVVIAPIRPIPATISARQASDTARPVAAMPAAISSAPQSGRKSYSAVAASKVA